MELIDTLTQFVLGLPEPLAYIALFFAVMLMSACLFMPVPVFALIAAVSTFLDPTLVGIVAGIGSAIGELSGYIVGLGGEAILRKKGKEGDRYRHGKEIFEKYGFFGISFAAFFPFSPIDFVGVLAGMLRYGWKKFLLATMIGKIPRYLLVSYMSKGIIDATMMWLF